MKNIPLSIIVLIIFLLNGFSLVSQSANKFSIKNLDSNQPYPEKGLAFFADDFIVFSGQIENTLGKHSRTRRRNKSKKVELLPQNLEFYFTPIDDNGNFVNNQKLSKIINSNYDDYGVAFSQDQSVVFFAREISMKNSTKKHLELFSANVLSPGSWVNIKKLSISSPGYSVGYPFLDKDDKTLYYTSNIDGNFDIFKVEVKGKNVVGKPIKLPSKINTSSNETTPYVFDNKLYFSSDKSGGLGGLDIYSTELNNENSSVLRLEAPINSEFDDFNFIKKDVIQGYFISNRPGGKGKEDIYFFKDNEVDNEIVSAKDEIKKKRKDIFQDEEDQMLASNKKTDSKITSINKISTIDNKKLATSNTIKSSTTTKENIKYVKNDAVYDYQRRIDYDAHSEKEKIVVKDGASSENIDDNANYKSKDEYSDCQMEFDNLNDIYFDYSETYIREDAAIELNKVIRVLRLCPKIVLLASSHTDSRASRSYNLKLSQERADNVVKYIINNGHFSPDRIISNGFGEERLANKCSDGVKCTEKEHQLNRRTHFEIYNY